MFTLKVNKLISGFPSILRGALWWPFLADALPSENNWSPKISKATSQIFVVSQFEKHMFSFIWMQTSFMLFPWLNI